MSFRFFPEEVAELEKILLSNGITTPPKLELEAIAERFNRGTERQGQRPIVWKQVWNWFQNRRHVLNKKGINATSLRTQPAAHDPSAAPTHVAPVGGEGTGAPASKLSAVSGREHGAAAGSAGGAKALDAPALASTEFEAKSARDGAWYDVDLFIDKRTSDSNQLEVRVRFAGFGRDEDEWVHVHAGVRQRSLPSEASECIAILPGDLVLCFQEGNEQALYFDADVLDVQRRRHDVRGCRCRFWVRYRHDLAEEVVPLRKLCRRPETDYRIHAANKAQATLASGVPPPSAVPGPSPVAPLYTTGA